VDEMRIMLCLSRIVEVLYSFVRAIGTRDKMKKGDPKIRVSRVFGGFG
jgi:hypothetical protein